MTTPITDLFPRDESFEKSYDGPIGTVIDAIPSKPISYNYEYPLSKGMESVVKEIQTVNKQPNIINMVTEKKKPNLTMYIYVFISSIVAFNPWLFKLIIYILTNQKINITIAYIAITMIGSLINTLLYYGIVNMYPIQSH